MKYQIDQSGKILSQQKTRLSTSFLTEYNTDAQRPDLSTNTLSQNTNNVKSVDPTGIEPANPDYSDLDVHQYRAHINLVYQKLKKIANRPVVSGKGVV